MLDLRRRRKATADESSVLCDMAITCPPRHRTTVRRSDAAVSGVAEYASYQSLRKEE
jgi:hypothetical protein